MSKKMKNLEQLSLDLLSNAQAQPLNTVRISKDKQRSHLTVVATPSGFISTKMQPTTLSPYSDEITRIIRDKGKSLGW